MSINKAILVGNVGADPKVTTYSSGKVAQVSLATTERGVHPAERHTGA